MQCSSIYFSEVSIVMNCNHKLHPEDLLSETEQVAPKSSCKRQERPHGIGNSTVVSSPYCLHKPGNTEISPWNIPGSLFKTAVVTNPLNNVCRNSEFYFIWRVSPVSFRHIDLSWNRSCMLKTKRDCLNSVRCAGMN